MRSCCWAARRRRPPEPSAPRWASSTPCHPGRCRGAPPRDGRPHAERVGLGALLLGEGGLGGLAQLRGVLAQAGCDAATTRLHVGTEARHVRLAGLARCLELLMHLVDVRLALGRELIRVLLETGMHACATRRLRAETGDVGCARTLRGGGCLLSDGSTGAEQGEEDEGSRGDD